MRLFNKHNVVASPWKDKVAKSIAGFIVKMNSGFAKYMNRCSAGLPSSTMKVILIVFLSIGTSLSFYFIVAALIKVEPSKSIKIDRISLPRNVEINADEKIQQGVLITHQEFQELERFTNYMDSLQKSEDKSYDSILLNRPGLMDSVKVLKQIYEQQNKEK